MNNIKVLFKRLLGIDLIKVFSLNALSTFVRMLAGMISVKIVAVIIGPTGIALLGQLKNLETILLGVANGGISSGITKYVAEYKDDDCRIKIYISNAFKITLIATFSVAIILILGCQQLSWLILMTDEYYYVFIVFGFTILLYTLNSLLISVLNGYKQFKKYVIVNIWGTILGLIYSIILVVIWGLPGAMINAVTYQSIVFFVTILMCRNLPWMKKEYFLERLNRPIVKKYLGYSAMALTTLALVPVSRILLRSYVISEISATDAGIWEGINSISSMYLSIITTALSIYYLPRLSEIVDPQEMHNEIFKCYKFIIPMLITISLTVYLLRHFIIWFLFTPEFSAMAGLFLWQLLGDFFKVCSWMLAFIMVAKAQTRRFITTEVFFTLLYILFAFVFLQLNGIVGLVQGYLINYIFYMLAMIYLFKNYLKLQKNGNTKNNSTS